jgi:pimeloyl-ACP methyl ester carboxylesterase
MINSNTVTTATVETPDGRLYYEVRGSGPVIALVGAPMDAESFAGLADSLASDHTVLTMDPRGIKRSPLTDPARGSAPEERADDLARLLTLLDAGPATVFGSSGGAVTSLAFAQAHPELVRIVVAHEPPLTQLLPDSDQQREQTGAMINTYLSGDVIGAWRKFFGQSGLPIPDELLEAWFGGERDPQIVADERFWFEHELPASVHWQPDLARLRDGRVRIVIGLGDESAGQLCERTCRALAGELGGEPVSFPGDHTGFTDHPDAFADRLRVLQRRDSDVRS